MTMSQLLQRNHGLVVIAGASPASARPTLWEPMSHACDSLYLVGPLAEKPVLPGPAKVWLLECRPEEREQGLRIVRQRDAHGIHLIGPATAALGRMAVNAALSGSLCVVELEAPDVTGALAAIQGWNEEAVAITASLLGIVVAGAGDPAVWTLTPARAEAYLAGASASELAAMA